MLVHSCLRSNDDMERKTTRGNVKKQGQEKIPRMLKYLPVSNLTSFAGLPLCLD